MTDFAVFDSHVHIQPWDMIKPDVLKMMQGKRPDVAEIRSLMYDPALLLQRMDAERIERICAINYQSPDIMGFTDEANRYIADTAKKCGGRVIPYGSVHPRFAKEPEKQMDDLVAWGIRGVKMHPSHQLDFPNAYRSGNRNQEVMYRRAEQAGLVLMVHTGTSIFPGARNLYADPIYCDDIGVDFPKLRVILAHGGRPLWMETAMFVVRRFPNFYMDVSSIPPQNLPEYFPDLERLADKVLWGSDWPAPGVPGMRSNVEKFLALPYSDETKRKILHDNAAKLYAA